MIDLLTGWLTDWMTDRLIICCYKLTDYWLTDWTTLLTDLVTTEKEGLEWPDILILFFFLFFCFVLFFVFVFICFYFFFFSFTSTNLYDDTWQHVCLTWENTQGVTKLYKDGQFTEQVTNHATKNYTLKAGGFLVLGQEQDSIGGGFDRNQTLHGRLASVNMWDKVLSKATLPLSTQIAAYRMVLFLTGLYSKVLLMAMSQLKSRELNCLVIKHSKPITHVM